MTRANIKWSYQHSINKNNNAEICTCKTLKIIKEYLSYLPKKHRTGTQKYIYRQTLNMSNNIHIKTTVDYEYL